MQSVCLKAILGFGDIKGQLVCLQGTRLFFSFICMHICDVFRMPAHFIVHGHSSPPNT